MRNQVQLGMSIIQQLNNVIRKQIGRYITGVSHSMNQNFTYLCVMVMTTS